MANTYSQLTIQVVFAVKGRENFLLKKFRPELFKYISGVVNGSNQTALAVNGWQDHVHVLFGLQPASSISDLVRDIKSNSSRWINDNKLIKGKFQWQEGYAAFSYSKSQRDSVINYIVNQETHHAKESFKTEYLEMLRKAEIEFDDRYLFDFYENDEQQ